MLLRALIKEEDKGYRAVCLEFPVAANGNTVQEALDNLKFGLEAYFAENPNTEPGRLISFAYSHHFLEDWVEFFQKEDLAKKKPDIAFYSIVAKKDGSRVINYPNLK